MTEAEILQTVLREMCCYGSGWRANWSEFDGRILRDQLNALADWAKSQLAADGQWVGDYTDGGDFCKEQWAP